MRGRTAPFLCGRRRNESGIERAAACCGVSERTLKRHYSLRIEDSAQFTAERFNFENAGQETKRLIKKGVNILEVKVFDNDVEKALKILKNKLSKSGLFKELKVRRAYEKPSVKRKRKAIEARRRLAKVQRRKAV